MHDDEVDRVRDWDQLPAALQRARDESHPSYIEVRLEQKMVTAMSEPDFETQYQTSQPSSLARQPGGVA